MKKFILSIFTALFILCVVEYANAQVCYSCKTTSENTCKINHVSHDTCGGYTFCTCMSVGEEKCRCTYFCTPPCGPEISSNIPIDGFKKSEILSIDNIDSISGIELNESVVNGLPNSKVLYDEKYIYVLNDDGTLIKYDNFKRTILSTVCGYTLPVYVITDS